MRRLDHPDAERFMEAELDNDFGQMSQHMSQTYFAMLMHPQHAFFTYLMGVVRGVMDAAQTADFVNCRPPVTAVADVGRCVCGDHAMRIPASHSRAVDLS